MRKIMALVFASLCLAACNTTGKSYNITLSPSRTPDPLDVYNLAGIIPVGDEMVSYWRNRHCNFVIIENYPEAVQSLINITRTDYKVGILNLSKPLSQAALGHVVDMACQDYFAHVALDGSDPAVRSVTAGYRFDVLHEDLAKYNVVNFNDVIPSEAATTTVDMWIVSASHKEALLDPNVLDLGAALACGYSHENGNTYENCYAATEFGRLRK
jgi:hypothetical protein